MRCFSPQLWFRPTKYFFLVKITHSADILRNEHETLKNLFFFLPNVLGLRISRCSVAGSSTGRFHAPCRFHGNETRSVCAIFERLCSFLRRRKKIRSLHIFPDFIPKIFNRWKWEKIQQCQIWSTNFCIKSGIIIRSSDGIFERFMTISYLFKVFFKNLFQVAQWSTRRPSPPGGTTNKFVSLYLSKDLISLVIF